jgi:small-conductance mechanosensitive channel
LATFVFILVVVAILKIHGKILTGMQHGLTRKYGTVLEDTRARRAWDSIIALLNFVRLIGITVLFLAYLQTVLSFLPWTRPVAGKIMSYVLVPLRSMGQTFLAQLPNLFFLAVLSVVTYYFLKFIQIFFSLIEAERISIRGFDPEWSKPTFNIVRFLVISFALVVAFPYLPGSDSPAFKGITVFIGVLFSLGSSSAIANVIAGLSLSYRKAFHVGDLISIGETTGTVTAIRLAVTHVRTPKNEMVTVPNSHIMSANVSTIPNLQGAPA